MDPEELDSVYAFAIQLAKAAGQKLLDAAQARYGDGRSHLTRHVEKESAVDIVTQTDEDLFEVLLYASIARLTNDFEDIEAFLKHQVNARFPHHRFVGEESYSKGESKQYLIHDDDPVGTWCIDPLDGTVNYTHLFPMVCVSIAFVWKGTPVVGVINAPFLQQLFSACTGRGAWLNEVQQLPLIRNPAPPLPADAPKGCIFSCEWGKDRRDSPDSNLHRKVETFVNMAAELGSRNGKGAMVHGMRSLGSATLDLCYVAMGSFDIWWEGGCWEWDVAAGICLLQEAGGLVTTANPPQESNAPIEDAKLGSRLYLAIRPAGDTPTETGRQAQERVVREVWRRVRHLDYTRPGP